MNLVFRNVRTGTDDLDRAVSLMHAFAAAEGLPFEPTRTRANILLLANDDTYGCVRLIDCDGSVAGYLVVTFGFSFEFGGRDAFLDEIYVEPAYRRRGIGAQGVQEAERICRERGIGALHLEVDDDNLIAQRIYQSAGFENHRRLLMTKHLDAVHPGA